MKTFTTTILALWALICIGQPTAISITHEQALEDLQILKTSLAEIHPNIYRYTAKSEFDKAFNNVCVALNEKTSVKEFYNLIAPIIALVRCGHTFGIPSFTNNRRLLPLDVKILDNRIYVLKNFSTAKEPSKGSEILELNGIQSSAILKDFRNKSIADGYGITFKDRTIEKDFKRKYATFINQPDSFEIKFIDYQTQTTKTAFLSALSDELIEETKTQGNLNSTAEKPLAFLIDKRNNVGILRLRSFMAKNIRKEHGQNLRKTIRKSFKNLKQEKIDNLIIDIRYNTGGKVFAPTLLFSYLTDKDFRFGREIRFRHGYKFSYPEYLNRNKLNDWFNRKLDRKINDSTYAWTLHRNTGKLFKAKRNAFLGNLYIIVNGMTASAGAEFASLAKAHGVGAFVGEETGGDYNGVNGFDRTYLQLPHSRIGVLIAGWRGVMAWEQSENIGHGVIPDYKVHPTLKDILDGKDTEMQFVYELIENKETPNFSTK